MGAKGFAFLGSNASTIHDTIVATVKQPVKKSASIKRLQFTQPRFKHSWCQAIKTQQHGKVSVLTFFLMLRSVTGWILCQKMLAFVPILWQAWHVPILAVDHFVRADVKLWALRFVDSAMGHLALCYSLCPPQLGGADCERDSWCQVARRILDLPVG